MYANTAYGTLMTKMAAAATMDYLWLNWTWYAVYTKWTRAVSTICNIPYNISLLTNRQTTIQQSTLGFRLLTDGPLVPWTMDNGVQGQNNGSDVASMLSFLETCKTTGTPPVWYPLWNGRASWMSSNPPRQFIIASKKSPKCSWQCSSPHHVHEQCVLAVCTSYLCVIVSLVPIISLEIVLANVF